MSSSGLDSLEKKFCIKCLQSFPSTQFACPNDNTELIPYQESQRASIPKILDDRYEIVSLIARGGMSSVYKANDLKIGRPVAIKMLSAESARHVDALRRFERAAKVAGKLVHKNIVSVHELVMSKDHGVYLVTDWVDGITLDQSLAASGPFSLERGVHIFTQVCDALACAHTLKVVHRNIKPCNILLTQIDNDPDFVKIVDFGIAKALPEPGAVNQKITRTGFWVGSPLYMSPEQCIGHKVDERSDIYSLGCVMKECFTGVAPNLGGAELGIEFHFAKQKSPEVGMDGKVSLSLAAILAKALANKPDDRYQRVVELREDLQTLKKGGTVRTLQQIQLSNQKAEFRRSSNEAASEPAISQRTLKYVLVTLAILLGALLSFFYYLHEKSLAEANNRSALRIRDELLPIPRSISTGQSKANTYSDLENLVVEADRDVGDGLIGDARSKYEKVLDGLEKYPSASLALRVSALQGLLKISGVGDSGDSPEVSRYTSATPSIKALENRCLAQLDAGWFRGPDAAEERSQVLEILAEAYGKDGKDKLSYDCYKKVFRYLVGKQDRSIRLLDISHILVDHYVSDNHAKEAREVAETCYRTVYGGKLQSSAVNELAAAMVLDANVKAGTGEGKGRTGESLSKRVYLTYKRLLGSSSTETERARVTYEQYEH